MSCAEIEMEEAGCKRRLPLSTLHSTVPESPAFATATGNTFGLVKMYSLYSRHLKIWDAEVAHTLALVVCFLFLECIPSLPN